MMRRTVLAARAAHRSASTPAAATTASAGATAALSPLPLCQYPARMHRRLPHTKPPKFLSFYDNTISTYATKVRGEEATHARNGSPTHLNTHTHTHTHTSRTHTHTHLTHTHAHTLTHLSLSLSLSLSPSFSLSLSLPLSSQLPRKISIRQLYDFGESAKHSMGRLVQSGRYLHRELPIRLAQRLDDFLRLPFIVGCNPSLQVIFQAYADAFVQMRTFPDIKNEEDEAAYTEIIKDYIDDHQHIVTLLASACREARGYCDNATLDA
jgi:hypothetical protein